MDPARGRLLVATPGLADPNFASTVVLLLEQGAEGALGLVVNRPTPLPVAEVLPEWADAVTEPRVIFRGGPVQAEAVIALGRVPGVPAAQQVLPGVAPVDLREHASADRLRVFAGYAGWSPGQIEAEVAAGGWFVVAATPEDLTTRDPDGLWRRVLTRAGGVFTTATEDPTRN